MIELISIAEEKKRQAIHEHEEFLKDIFAEVVYRIINSHYGYPCHLCRNQDACLRRTEIFHHNANFPKECAISVINSIMHAIAQEKAAHDAFVSDPFLKMRLVT